MKVERVTMGPLGEVAAVAWLDELGRPRSTTVAVSWHHRDEVADIEAGHYVDVVAGDQMSEANLIDLAVWLDADREARLAASDVDNLFDRSDAR